MAAAAPASFEHPSLKEGFSDKLYRYVNEMVKISQILFTFQDFKGQELAEKIISRGMIGCSVSKVSYVSIFLDHSICSRILNTTILQYSLYNACLHVRSHACKFIFTHFNSLLASLLDHTRVTLSIGGLHRQKRLNLQKQRTSMQQIAKRRSESSDDDP